MDVLNGKKTYIIVALIAAATVANRLGYIDDETYKMILGLLGAGGLTTLRQAIGKSEQTSKTAIQAAMLSSSNLNPAAATMRNEAFYAKQRVGTHYGLAPDLGPSNLSGITTDKNKK